MDYLASAGALLINTFLGLYLYLVLLRFWMQVMRADFANPIGQFVISVTNPVIVTLRALLPPIGKIDTASVVFAWLIATLKISLILWLTYSQWPHALQMLVFGLSEMIRASVHIFIAAIFVMVVASWVASGGYHPLVYIANQLVAPLLTPLRRLLPSFSGLDFTPLFLLVFLQLLLILVVAPLAPPIR